MSVPKNMQGKYDEIAALITPFCDEYLNAEYKALCFAGLGKLSTCAVNIVASDEMNLPDFKAFSVGRRWKSPLCFCAFAREEGNSFPPCV